MPKQPSMRYQNRYVWLVFLSAMDIMLTWIVLHFDGHEENILAYWVLDHYGLAGLVYLKFAAMIFVILMCEFIGRIKDAVGGKLATFAVVVNAAVVLYTLVILLIEVFSEPETTDLTTLSL